MFKKLIINGTPQELSKMNTHLLKLQNDNWETSLMKNRIDASIKAEWKGNDVNSQSAMVSLTVSEDPYTVVDIVPTEFEQLTYREYHNILEQFYTDLIQPLEKDFKITTEMTKATVRVEDYIGEGSAWLLKEFSFSANKIAGTIFHEDEEKWNDFLISVNLEGVKLPTDILEEHLVSDGWSEEMAHNLAIEFETGIKLLDDFKIKIGYSKECGKNE